MKKRWAAFWLALMLVFSSACNADASGGYTQQLENSVECLKNAGKIYDSAMILLDSHRLFTTGYYDDAGKYLHIDLGKLTDNSALDAYALMFGDTLTAAQGDLIRSATVAESIMMSLSTTDKSQTLSANRGFKSVPMSILKQLMAALGISENVVNEYKEFALLNNYLNYQDEWNDSGAVFYDYQDLDAYFKENEQINLKDDELFSGFKSGMKVIDMWKTVDKILDQWLYFSNVDDEEAIRIADTLRKTGDPDLIRVAEFLKIMTDDEDALVYLLTSYGVGKVTDSGADALKNLVGGVLPKGYVFAIKGATSFNDLVFGVKGIQKSAYEAQWAIDAADAYYPTFMNDLYVFLSAPITNYEHFRQSYTVFAELVAEEYEAYAGFTEEADSGLWKKITNWVGLTDDNENLEETCNDLADNLRTCLDYNLDSFYESYVNEKEVASEETWTCPNCGIGGLTSRYCTGCGTKHPEENWVCSVCGVRNSTNFCTECGMRKTTELLEIPAQTSKNHDMGSIIVSAGTVIRADSSASSAGLMTTDRQRTFRYESCKDGWYRIILDNGNYGYVYYTRVNIIALAVGDDGTHGITGGSIDRGSSGKSGSSGNGGSSGGGGGSNPTGDGNHDHFWVAEAVPMDGQYHQMLEYDWYWDTFSGQYQKSAAFDAGVERHTFSNGVCSKCGYGASSKKTYVPYSTAKHVVRDNNGNESYENHNFVNGRCSTCGYVSNPDFSPWQPNYKTDYEQKDAQSHWKISYHYEGTDYYRAIDSQTEEAHTFSNGVCSKCGYIKE